MKLAALVSENAHDESTSLFVKLGECFISRGHHFTLCPFVGTSVSTFGFDGPIHTFDELQSFKPDITFAASTDLLPALEQIPSRCKVFYYLRREDNLRPVLSISNVQIFVNSTSMYREVIQRFHITPFKAPGGVDFGVFTPKDLGTHEGPFTILTEGRLLGGRSGTGTVIRACERLYRKKYDVRLIVVHTSKEEQSRKRIEKITCRLPHKIVRESGPSEWNGLFHEADIFVSAAKDFSWDSMCANAMAAGLPLVAANPGTEDFLEHGITGLKAKRTRFSLAKAIRILIDSPDYRIQLATAGNRHIRNFDWDVLVDRILRRLTQ